jgi:hypothetical protein
VAYEIEDEKSGLWFRFRGSTSMTEIMEANARGWEHPRLENHHYQLWDFTDVDTIQLDDMGAKAIAIMDNTAFQVVRHIKIALVTGGRDSSDLCEAYVSAVETDTIDAKIFDTLAVARQWVGN